MATYVPGTQEKDLSKVIMSLQQIGPGLDALSATVAGLPSTTGVTNVATSGLATGGPITATGTITVTAAVQSDQETSTSNTVAVTPGVQQFHPSAAKAWVKFDGTAGSPTVAAGYNVSSITKTGTGQYTISFTTAFSSANYSGSLSSVSAGVLVTGNGGQLAGSFTVRSVVPPATNTDTIVIAVFYGDQ